MLNDRQLGIVKIRSQNIFCQTFTVTFLKDCLQNAYIKLLSVTKKKPLLQLQIFENKSGVGGWGEFIFYVRYKI